MAGAEEEKRVASAAQAQFNWDSWQMSTFLFFWHVASWTLWTLMIRFSRGDEDSYAYDTVTVVLMTEVFKLVFSICFHFCYVPTEQWHAEAQQIVSQYQVGAYYAVPAVIYSLYNMLMYLNLTLFSPTNYRVLINIRVLWSGVLFQLMFSTKLGMYKWAGLVLLMAGCAVNQITPNFTLNSSFFALFCICFQAFLSSAGGVYSEFLLKKNVDISLVVKNIYLYFWSTLSNLLYIVFFKPDLLFGGQFFRGWTSLTVWLVVIGALCGFSTAIFLRYLNVLLKEFAHSAEMMVTAVLTYFLFGDSITGNILISILLVGCSIYLYNYKPAEERSK